MTDRFIMNPSAAEDLPLLTVVLDLEQNVFQIQHIAGANGFRSFSGTGYMLDAPFVKFPLLVIHTPKET